MSDRIYVPLADVAAACGIPGYKILTRHLPEDWAVPRDYRLLPPRYSCLIAEASLPQLVAQLRQDGCADAATALEQWRTTIATEESHQDFTARHSAPPREASEPWWKKGQFA